jgi:hypothetical protein
MEDGIKVLITKTKNKDREHTLGPMVRNILAAGVMAYKTEKENSQIPNYKEEVENGNLEKELHG